MVDLFSFYKEFEESKKPYQIWLPWHLEYEEGEKDEDGGKIVYSLKIFGRENKLFVKELWKAIDIEEIENFLDFQFKEYQGIIQNADTFPFHILSQFVFTTFFIPTNIPSLSNTRIK